MLGSQHPDKSAVGRKRTDSASASITEKSNLQLLNEVEAMLSVPAEEMDTDRIEEYLSLLQKKAPVTEHYDPEEKWAKLEESHPLIFEEEPNSCKSDLAAEARNRHGNRTRRSFSRVFRAAAIAAAAAFCFIITASAMGFQPVQAVLRWAEGIIQIYTNPSGIMTTIPASIIPCMRLWRQTGSVQKVCPHGYREIMRFRLLQLSCQMVCLNVLPFMIRPVEV